MQAAINKASIGVANASNTTSEFDKHMGPDAEIPSPPVYAARISGLLKTLANAEGAVCESIKARKDIIQGLEKLLGSNRTALAKEEAQITDLKDKKGQAETKKREIEDEILRKLPTGSPQYDDGPGADYHHAGEEDMDRPQMEELTPPPVESFTPLQSPKQEAAQMHSNGNGYGEYSASVASIPIIRTYSGSPTGNGMNKRRRMDNEHQDFVQGDAMADIDEDVAELLRQESGQS